MTADYSQHRPEYSRGSLHESGMDEDPVRQFEQWLEEAARERIELPNAMVLATASRAGRPSARYVLLKGVDERGFVLYSHSTSAKGADLESNPFAALVFYWQPLHRQVRIEGPVERVDDAEAEAYFATRPHGSQISVWIAPQSSIIAGREVLEQRFAELSRKYRQSVPRPDTWVGYRVIPERVEFWQGRENRLHDRVLYSKSPDGTWIRRRLAP